MTIGTAIPWRAIRARLAGLTNPTGSGVITRMREHLLAALLEGGTRTDIIARDHRDRLPVAEVGLYQLIHYSLALLDLDGVVNGTPQPTPTPDSEALRTIARECAQLRPARADECPPDPTKGA